MNKQRVRKEFLEQGIIVEKFEFSENGHRLQVRIKDGKLFGFEELDLVFINGFNIVSPKYVEDSELRITLVPNNENEFTYYIQKYINSFGLSRSTAMTELERIISDLGDPTVLNKFNKYKNKFKERQK